MGSIVVGISATGNSMGSIIACNSASTLALETKLQLEDLSQRGKCRSGRRHSGLDGSLRKSSTRILRDAKSDDSIDGPLYLAVAPGMPPRAVSYSEVTLACLSILLFEQSCSMVVR